ncbi:Uncharacterised protein [Chromobacterium violaceum]|uniref:Uncharacterized protein n=1 Tax=Chromobacterium violaceum TaxID=536 RepID=A0A447TI06_CHRVL|nr:Uncharacterised protein [Chromobacterium violaceum]
MVLIGQFDFNLHKEFRQASQELLDNPKFRKSRLISTRFRFWTVLRWACCCC